MPFPNKTKNIFDVFFLLIYTIITFIIIFYHEPWRDEAQSWLIARNDSLFQILSSTLRYEQHPPLWYLVLFPFAKFGLTIFAQSFIHWILAVITVGVFLFKAPFQRIVKYIFMFSFLMFHEYVVIARNYTTGVLLMFLIAAFYQQRKEKSIMYGLLIFLLFNANTLLLPFGLSLTILYGFEINKEKGWNKKKVVAFSLMGIGAMIALFYGLCIPSDHVNFGVKTDPNYFNALLVISKIFFPVYWDVAQWLAITISLSILVVVSLALINNLSLLFTLMFSYAGMLYVFIFKYEGFMRQIGLMLMILLFVLWVDSYSKKRGKEKEIFSLPWRTISLTVITLCLLLSIKYSVWANMMDYKGIFSGAKLTAQAIQEISNKMHWENEVIVGYPDGQAASVAVHLPKRKFWYPDLEEFGTYCKLKTNLHKEAVLSPEDLVIRTGKKFGGIFDVIFLFSSPLTKTQIFNYEFKLIYSVDKGVWGYGLEKYYVYKAIPIREKKVY